MTDFAERLRTHIRNIEADDDAANYVPARAIAAFREAADLIDRQQEEIAERNARIAKLESRLEIDHVWVSNDGGPMERVEIPPAERDDQIDGIECRDETIKLARAVRDRLTKDLEEARAAIAHLIEKTEPFVDVWRLFECGGVQIDTQELRSEIADGLTWGDLRSLSEAVAKARTR